VAAVTITGFIDKTLDPVEYFQQGG